MAMVVKNNMTAINTLNTLNKNSSALSKSLQKVSSGMKINSAADDASGYAISERMRVQIRSLDQANQNTQNGSSMMKVAEGAVSSTVEILKTLKEKAVNAANDSNTDSDRQTIQKELDQSIDQINDNANVTFNGKYLVDGSKNTKGNATYTALSNQNLHSDTTATTALTSLKSKSGDSLEIHNTDKVTVSYVQAGKTYSTTFQVQDENGKVATLQDIFDKAEAIDDTGLIFANKGNDSIAKALGKGALSPGDKATLEAKEKDYTDKLKAYNVQDKTTTAAKNAYEEAAETVKNDIAIYNAGTVDSAKRISFTWDNSKTTAENLTSLVAKTNYNEFAGSTILSGGDQISVHVNSLKNAIAAYTGGTFPTAVTASAPGKDVGDATAADAAGAVADLKTAKNALTDAENAYKLVGGGAYLLTGSNVGMAASNDMVTTASGGNAITITAHDSGIGGQISGFNISISDSQGNVKKSANAALDAFEETIRAQNKSDDNAISLQVGAKANQSIKVGLTDMRAEALGLQGADGTKLNISTQNKANAAINVLDNAIQKALDQQTTIGSVESRLEYTSSNLTTASENVQASESTIRDADMAKEMTNYTKNNVLLQAAQSMLAQANQSSSNVLSLLQ